MMKIVLFGFRYHPYTLDIIKEFNDKKIPITAIIEPEPNYTTTQINNSPDVDDDFISNLQISSILSFWAIKNLVIYPKSSLQMGIRILKIKSNKKNRNSLFRDIPLVKVKNPSGQDCEKILKEIKPDLIVLGPASSIIRKNILNIPKIGVINAHMGLLPEFRGMNALEWTIFHKHEGAITIHFVDEGIDTGNILQVVKFPIQQGMRIKELRVQARKRMAHLLIDSIENIISGDYSSVKQDPYGGKQYFVMHSKLVHLIETEFL